MYRALFFVWVTVIAVFTGCDSHETTPAKPEAGITNYPARGVVQAVRADGKTVVIKHEEIPGYMMAMTMPFEARNTNELAGVKAGDAVSFRLRVTDRDGWIDQLKVLTPAPATNAPATNTPPPFRLLPNVPELKAGDPLPDYAFTNELGRAVQLADYRGQALAFTFIFTRCPFPNFCPRMSDHLSLAQKRLAQTPGAPTNWHLLSISFDPEYDTPERLAEYGRRFGQDPARWSLLNGSFDQIERLAGHFGLYFGRNVAIADQNHNLRTVVVDASGKVRQIFVGNEWSVDDLVAAITEATHAK
jgi:protein SCO1